MASDSLRGLEPASVWRHFEALCRIPRASGNEGAAADYVRSVAERQGLETRRDAVGNVVVARRASAGREGRPGVVLQGHLDMVCEKEPGLDHDFSKDALDVYREGEWIRARGTTLGADNGVGVAMALAALEERERPWPRLEALFTLDEEEGLIGANGIDPGLVEGRTLLNIDSEEEGALYIGCAGGQTTTSRGALPLRPLPHAHHVFRVAVGGLRGGHSGLDIHLGRGNAIRLLARLLFALAEEGDLRLVSLEGGSKHNAIPRDADATFALAPRAAKALPARVREAEARYRSELAGEDDGVRLTVTAAVRPDAAVPPAPSRRLLSFLLGVPNGVAGWSRAVPGLVETSSNLAVVRLDGGDASVVASQRSSVESRLDEIVARVRSVAELAGLEASGASRYPAWTPEPDSPLLDVAKRTWGRLHGETPKVKAIHAGLECGVLGQKFDGMRLLSFGPDIRGAHSPAESLRVASVARVYEFLLALLGELGT